MVTFFFEFPLSFGFWLVFCFSDSKLFLFKLCFINNWRNITNSVRFCEKLDIFDCKVGLFENKSWVLLSHVLVKYRGENLMFLVASVSLGQMKNFHRTT